MLDFFNFVKTLNIKNFDSLPVENRREVVSLFEELHYTLESFVDEGVCYTYDPVTGIVLSAKRVNADKATLYPLETYTKVEEIILHYSSFTRVPIQYDDSYLSTLTDLSATQGKVLVRLTRKILGLSRGFVLKSELRDGKDRSNFSKDLLKMKELSIFREIPTKIPKKWLVFEVNPMLVFKGNEDQRQEICKLWLRRKNE